MNGPDPEPNIEAIYSRVLSHADKLFGSLEDLQEAGGLGRLAAGMKPGSVRRAAEVLASVRRAIDEQLGQLKGNRRGARPG